MTQEQMTVADEQQGTEIQDSFIDETEETPAEDQGHGMETRTDASGQVEMTIAYSPLYDVCEELLQAKAQIHIAKKAFDDCEDKVIDQLKIANKGQVNHKGEIIQYIKGRTTKDHIRFKK